MQYRNFMTAPREAESSGIKKFSYYKNGVKVKFPKKGPPLRLQILPSYNVNNPADPQGFSTSVLPSGEPSAWFGMIQAAKFVGHGDWRATLPVLSLASFEGREPCPYLKLLQYCKNNPDWKYLVTKTGKFGAPDYQDAILKPVKSVLILNIVDVDNPSAGVQLGEFSYSIATELLDQENGLALQRNMQLDSFPGAAEALAQNPMLAYANGDITDPGRAPVMVVELPPVRPGQFGAGYTIRIEVVGNQVSRRSASITEMESRYHLEDPASFLNIPSGQDIVDELVTLLSGHVNARGIDETCAIKEAVGDMYRVGTVSAPGAVSTVQAGWSAPRAPQPAPAPAAPAAPQYQTYTPPAASAAPVAPAPAAAPQGFGANPALATPAAPAAPAAPVPGAIPSGIPGELSASEEAKLAASLADRMRAQMNLRK